MMMMMMSDAVKLDAMESAKGKQTQTKQQVIWGVCA